MTLSDKFVISGYPRSGNTYLSFAFKLLYYPDLELYRHTHTVIAITKSDKAFVPFRNPVDSIASWNEYPLSSKIQDDIKYYIRFYKGVLDNLDKAVLMDFDYFTKDIEYIKSKVLKNLGIGTDNYVTNELVKQEMLLNGKQNNLPRNNQDQLNAVKEQLVNEPLFEQCVELYNKLKEQ